MQTSLEIEKIIPETADFKTIIFKSGHGIPYKPGQFLTLIHDTGFGEIRRSYSIISSPALNEPLAIGVKRVSNGIVSRKLVDEAIPGDLLVTTGAGGMFTLPPDVTGYNTMFFFAAGAGITPVYSLLKTILHAHPHIRAILVYSNREPATTAYLAALKNLKQHFPDRFFIEFVYSNTADLMRAHLNHDLLISYLRSYKIDPLKTLFYTCGPESYMRMIMYVLKLKSVPKHHIRKEDFIPVKKATSKLKPPDTLLHEVTIHFNQDTFKFPVQYPDTILQAAKKKKISLPYSCEAGTCGNCAAICTVGKVWLLYNEVLTDSVLDQGITLTCVGYPVDGDVTLHIGSPNG